MKTFDLKNFLSLPALVTSDLLAADLPVVDISDEYSEVTQVEELQEFHDSLISSGTMTVWGAKIHLDPQIPISKELESRIVLYIAAQKAAEDDISLVNIEPQVKVGKTCYKVIAHLAAIIRREVENSPDRSLTIERVRLIQQLLGLAGLERNMYSMARLRFFSERHSDWHWLTVCFFFDERDRSGIGFYMTESN